MDINMRTILFIPGNNPNLITNADLLGSDGVVFDLEDAVPKHEKDSARILVRNALRDLDLEGISKCVRINGLNTEWWEEDLELIAMVDPDVLMIPKVENAEEVQMVCRKIEEVNKQCDSKLFIIIETALGIERAFSIGQASHKIAFLSIGGEDFSADLGATRTRESKELEYARSRIVVAARASGVSPIDTVFPRIEDIEGLKEDTINAKNLGFDGKIAIAPRQVDIINDIYTPSYKSYRSALALVKASIEAEKLGKGVFSYKGKMVDGPVVDQQRRIIDLYERVNGGERYE